MQVNRPVQPQAQGPAPVKPSNIIVPAPSTDVKVKSRSPERMQELQQAVTKKGDNVLGSKAQTALIKAKIEGVSVTGIQDQAQKAPMSKWTIAARVLGGLVTAGISELVINRGAIKAAITGVPQSVSTKYNNFAKNLDYSVGERYIDAGNKALGMADRLDHMLIRMTEHAQLEGEINNGKRRLQTLETSDPITPQMHSEIRSLSEKVRNQESRLGIITENLNQNRAEFGDGNMQSLRAKMMELRTQGKEAVEIGNDIKGGKLEMAEKYGAKNMLKIGGLGHGVFSVVNSVALAKHVVDSGTNLLNITAATKEAASATIGVTQSAVGTASFVAAPVTILMEGRELYQTYHKHSKALSKVQMANALLSTDDRAAMKTEFQKKLTKAENGGWFSKPNPTKAAALRAKIQALDGLPAPGTLSDETKAMATQIKKHADVAHKRATMVKNTVAITAAVLTIATVALGPAAPVALALAATILGVGAAVYGISLLVKKYRTSSQRQNQINTLTNNHSQIEMKRTALTTEKGEIAQKTQDLTAKKQLHTERIAMINQFKQDHQIPTAASLEKFASLDPPLTREHFEGNYLNLHQNASQNAIEFGINPQLEHLAQRNQGVDAKLGQLADLQKQNTIALLACSPHDAAERIHAGATATPPDTSMVYLAEHVLRVDVKNLPPEVAKEQLARGMSLSPEE